MKRYALHPRSYNYFVSVTNDYSSDAEAIESEHSHKAQIEPMVRELKENFGLHVLRKHELMANWTWILLVATAHNLLRWTQLLGSFEPKDLRAKRFRYRYLNVLAILVRSGRQLILRLRSDYAFLKTFLASLRRLQRLPAT